MVKRFHQNQNENCTKELHFSDYWIFFRWLWFCEDNESKRRYLKPPNEKKRKIIFNPSLVRLVKKLLPCSHIVPSKDLVKGLYFLTNYMHTPQKPAEGQIVIASSIMQWCGSLRVDSSSFNASLDKVIGNLKRNSTRVHLCKTPC